MACVLCLRPSAATQCSPHLCSRGRGKQRNWGLVQSPRVLCESQTRGGGVAEFCCGWSGDQGLGPSGPWCGAARWSRPRERSPGEWQPPRQGPLSPGTSTGPSALACQPRQRRRSPALRRERCAAERVRWARRQPPGEEQRAGPGLAEPLPALLPLRQISTGLTTSPGRPRLRCTGRRRRRQPRSWS